MSTLVDFVALTLLPVWRWRLVVEQLRAGQLPSQILEQHCAERAERGTVPGPVALREYAALALDRAGRAGLTPISWDTDAYPVMLAAIIDPPPVLWVRGAATSIGPPAVAVVGSRAGSPYALSAAERLAFDLAERGVIVVSGLARGVDSAAHRGALAAGGQTIAVLGCGADIVYPAEHRELAASIGRNGAVVSEFVPGTPPHPRFFPQRNRIISGLSRAVVVIEAGERSGSLITARCALDQGRDVLAVPGSILNGRNRGGHALLRDGAKIVETADDILEELGLSVREGREPSSGDRASKAVNDPGSTPESDPVLACLIPGESCDLDEICERSGLAPARLLTRLSELELDGIVRRLSGGRFVRLTERARF